jgi:hypothetical protein
LPRRVPGAGWLVEGTVMNRLFRLMAVLAIAAYVASPAPAAFAQGQGPGQAPGANAQEPPQIELTEKHILGFIAAQPDLEALEGQFEQGDSDNPDPKVVAELEQIAKKHGFANLAELEAVGFTISWVMSGIDPATKKYSEAYIRQSIKEEIAAVRAEKSIPAKEKQAMLKELEQALANVKPVSNRANIELVQKHYDKLDAMME